MRDAAHRLRVTVKPRQPGVALGDAQL